MLADFVVEWTKVQMPPAVIDQEYWTMYFNRSLMKKGASAWLFFVSLLEVRMRYMVRLHFPSSNNVAEYEALINVRGDSKLIVDQVMKESSCHDTKMAAYYREVR